MKNIERLIFIMGLFILLGILYTVNWELILVDAVKILDYHVYGELRQ